MFTENKFVTTIEEADLLKVATTLANSATDNPAEWAEVRVTGVGENLDKVVVTLGYAVTSPEIERPSWTAFTAPINDAVQYLRQRPPHPDEM